MNLKISESEKQKAIESATIEKLRKAGIVGATVKVVKKPGTDYRIEVSGENPETIARAKKVLGVGSTHSLAKVSSHKALSSVASPLTLGSKPNRKK